MQGPSGAATPTETVDVVVAGLGPGGCVAALQLHAKGLSTLAVEARGPEATRARLVLVRPRAQELLAGIGMADITQGRRASTIQQVEQRLRSELMRRAAAPAPAAGVAALGVAWHTRVVALANEADHVRVTLRDEPSGAQRVVRARHLVDATGGRLEPLGRTARVTTGPSHLVATAEYEAEPWFDGIAGVCDPRSREALILVPMRGRVGVTAYLDAPPGGCQDGAALVERFESLASRLGLGTPRVPALVVDVVQRALARPSRDRVVPIGDSVGTVDLWLGAGMSTAIEDGFDAADGVAAAQRAATPREQLAATCCASRRIFVRHRSRMRWGRLMVAARPLLVHLWPTLPLADVDRGAVRSPRGLWPALRLVAGRRPAIRT